MAELKSGDRVLVKYQRDRHYMERLVLIEGLNGEHYICTPDGDIYPEALVTPPLSSIVKLNPSRTPLAPMSRSCARATRPNCCWTPPPPNACTRLRCYLGGVKRAVIDT